MIRFMKSLLWFLYDILEIPYIRIISWYEHATEFRYRRARRKMQKQIADAWGVTPL